jgi:hypothetical protein
MSVVQDRNAIRKAALRIIRCITEWKPPKMTDARKDWLAPPISAFKRLEPLGFGLEMEDWWIFHPKDCPPDLVWPLNVGFVVEEDGNNTLSLERIRSVTAREARGYADIFSPFMIRADIGAVYDHSMLTAAMLYSWQGGKWIGASKRTLWEGYIPTKMSGKENLEGSESVRMATSMALRHRYEWAVALGLDGSPSIRFATDPTGIKEAYRVRDLPEGRDRREALMTWVSDHWRQARHDPDLEIYVRQHLRGALSFEWRGMQGEIIPAPYDIERRDRMIEERAAMKVAGTDRRPLEAKAK